MDNYVEKCPTNAAVEEEGGGGGGGKQGMDTAGVNT